MQSDDIHAEVVGDQGWEMGRADGHHQLARSLMPPHEVGQGEGVGVLSAHRRFRIFVPVTGQVDGEAVLFTGAVGRARVGCQAVVVQLGCIIVRASRHTCVKFVY